MDLRDYLRPLLKKWWLVVLTVLVAIASSYLATRQQPAFYRSSTTLMVGRSIENPNPSDSDLYLTRQLANTYADIARREPVRAGVMSTLGLEWLPEYTVSVVPETQLIEISVLDTIPDRAQAVAQELAQQLIQISPAGSDDETDARQAFIDSELDDLEASIKQTRDEITKKQSELAGVFSARQIADSETQIAALRNKLATLQSNYAALLQNTKSGATNTLKVIEPANPPTEPERGNKFATILLAAAVGFALATLTAYLLDYLDDTLKNPDDVQKHLGLVTVGGVPVIANARDRDGLVAASPSPAAEAYSVLRTNLQFSQLGQPLRSLLVSSATPYEGKSVTAANLSVALAQAGQRVILVDGDLRKPQLHNLFGLPNTMGLTTALLEKGPNGERALQETAVPGLRLLASGQLPPDPTVLLSSGRMRELWASLQADSEVVVIDSPPVNACADAAILSTLVDGVLLVIDAGRTRRDAARRALQGLTRVNAVIVGAVLNRMPPRGSEYYYYYHHSETGEHTSARRENKGPGRLKGRLLHTPALAPHAATKAAERSGFHKASRPDAQQPSPRSVRSRSG